MSDQPSVTAPLDLIEQARGLLTEPIEDAPHPLSEYVQFTRDLDRVAEAERLLAEAVAILRGDA